MAYLIFFTKKGDIPPFYRSYITFKIFYSGESGQYTN